MEAGAGDAAGVSLAGCRPGRGGARVAAGLVAAVLALVSSGAAAQPAKGGTAAQPAKGGAAAQPAKGGAAQPAKGGAAAQPAKGGVAQGASSPARPGAKGAGGSARAGARGAGTAAKPRSQAAGTGAQPAAPGAGSEAKSGAEGGAQGAGSAAQPSTPDEHFRKGNELYKAAKFAEAEASYEVAWAAKKTHDIAANLAYAEMYQGKHREAAGHLAFAVRSWPPTGKVENREYAVKRYAEMLVHVGALRVTVSRAGAEVVVDGEAVGVAPLADEVFVEPGVHMVEARLAGHEGSPVKVEAAAGEAKEVKLELQVTPPPKPPEVAVPAVDEGAGRRRKVILIAGGASAAVGLGLGIGFTAAANGKGTDANSELGALKRTGKLCPHESIAMQCKHLRGTLAERDTFQDVAVWSYALGGVAALATVGYALWPVAKGSATKTSVRLEPIFTGFEGGLRISSSF